MDQSCSPIEFEHIKKMSESYSRVGTVEATTRRLNILFTWFIAGRAAEGAWTLWSGATWSSRHGKLFIEVPQPKVCVCVLRIHAEQPPVSRC
jgi:hypothetical protein